MNKKDIVRSEFIGSSVEIVEAKNPTLLGLKGKIIDETKNSFWVMTKNNERKRLMKKNLRFTIKTRNQNPEIDGNKILMKPEHRIKIRE